MANNKKRLMIRNLEPGANYAVQIRASKGLKGTSKWSQKHHFKAEDDAIGGRKPETPEIVEFSLDGSGQYTGEWTTVNRMTDDSRTNVPKYEVELSIPGMTSSNRFFMHLSQTIMDGTTQSRAFTNAELKGKYNDQVPPTLRMRVRAINTAGNTSEWSEPETASMPVPQPPRNVVATGVIDGISMTWDAPEDASNVVGYRIHVGNNAAFVPTITNLAYSGSGKSYTYTTGTYDVLHYFKIYSFSAAGLESTQVSVSGKPKSPYGPDLIPPTVPVLGDLGMIRVAGEESRATAEWSIDEQNEANEDLAGFMLQWKRLGREGEFVRNEFFSKDARSGVFVVPTGWSDYEMRICAYDYLANYSDFSPMKILTAKPPPPAQVKNLRSDSSFIMVKLMWDQNTEQGMIENGRYEIQVNSTGNFPASAPADYTTGNTFIELVGLPVNSTLYARVRALDPANQYGPWSATYSVVVPDIPLPPVSDNTAPQVPPTGLKAVPGLNYVNLSWDSVDNDDATEYEVFIGTASNVSLTEANRVATTPATSTMVNSLPNGQPLAKNTKYYFKVRAKDYDGPGPASTAAEATVVKVLPDDFGIDLPGENLYVNSSFDSVSTGTGVADFWKLYHWKAPGSQTIAKPSMVAGRLDGLAQRVEWFTPSGTTIGDYIGVYSNPDFVEARVLKPDTKYVLSFYARASVPRIFRAVWNAATAVDSVEWVNNPQASATEWQRYVVKFRTKPKPNPVEPANAFIAITPQSGDLTGWLEIDDAQLEVGDIVSSYKTGTVSISKITSGRIKTAELIVSDNGAIRSENYNSTTGKGFILTKDRLDLQEGTVNAKTLQSGTVLAANLTVSGELVVSSNSGIIRSSNFQPYVSESNKGAGYRITSTSIDIRSGTIAADALKAGTIASTNIYIGSGGALIVDSTGEIRSKDYSLAGQTGWKISKTGIQMLDANSRISASALKGGIIEATTLYIGSGGGIQSSKWGNDPTGTLPRWRLSDAEGLEVRNGVIIGSSIQTDQLTSIRETSVFKNGAWVAKRTFSINDDGAAEFANARIYGNTVVGTGSTNVIQSGNYVQDVSGWKISGDGNAEFANILSRTSSGTYVRIASADALYESNQNWALIQMGKTGTTGWWPAQMWYNNGTTSSQEWAFVKISSPRGSGLTAAPPSFLNLFYNKTTNESNAQLEGTIVTARANVFRYTDAVSTSTKMELTPNNFDMRSPYFNFNPTVAFTPVVFRIEPPMAPYVDTFSFRRPGAAPNTGGGGRIDFTLTNGFHNQILSKADDSTRENLQIIAKTISFDISGSTPRLQMMATTATAPDNVVPAGTPWFGKPDGWAGLSFISNGVKVTNWAGSSLLELYASNVAYSSDMSAKENVSEVKGKVRDSFKTLSAYDFDYKATAKKGKSGGKGRTRGLSAQEIQEAMPEAVMQSEDDEQLTVSVGAMIANLTKAFNELQQEFDDFKASVESERGSTNAQD